jgi:hypothetical protein
MLRVQEENMRVVNLLVFDEHLTNSTTNHISSYTDQLALMAVVDSASGAGFKVQIEHSADGRMWLPKSGGTLTKPNAAEIGGDSGETLKASIQTAYFGADAGTTPTLAYVRLRVELGTSSSAHVRVFVTGRNWGSR